MNGWRNRLATPAAGTLLVGLVALGLYVYTLAPGLVWADGGRLQVDAVTGGSLYWHFDELAGIRTDGWPFERLGVAAWDHPVWVMLGHGLASLPFAEPAWWLNLLSALPAAGTVALIYLIVRRFTAEPWGAVAAAAALAVSHVFWLHAVVAQVHALNAFFTTLLIYLALTEAPLRPGRMLRFAVVAGLGMANHVMLGLPVLVSAAFMVMRHRRAGGSVSLAPVAGAVGCFLLGLAPWWVQFLRMVNVAGLPTTLQIAAGFPWLGDRWPGPLGIGLLTNLLNYGGILLYQFTPIGCVAGAYGAVRLWQRHRPQAGYLLILFGLQVVFSANYNVPDRFAFHLPSYLLFAVFVGCGVSDVVGRVGARWTRGLTAAGAVVLMLIPIVLYAVTPRILRERGVTDADFGIPTVGVAGRDGLTYFLNPNKRGDNSPERYGRMALEGVAPGALVLMAWPDDREPYVVMRYFQLAENLRPDVELDLMMFTGASVHDSVLAIAAAQQDCRPIYLVSDDPAVYPVAELRHSFDIQLEGTLYHLLPTHDTIEGCDVREPVSVSLTDLVEKVRR